MSSIKRDSETGEVVLRLDPDDAFTLRVALSPVQVGEVSSARTQQFRDRVSKAIARLLK